MKKWSYILLIFIFIFSVGYGLNYSHKGVLILHYHAVNNNKNSSNVIRVYPKEFEWQMVFLKKQGYHIISLDEAVNYLKNNSKLPSKALAITFDDGYLDNYTVAYPILKKYNYPATIFLPTGFISGTNQWDAKKGLPKERIMNWTQIKEMSKSGIISFQPHTVHHYNVTRIAEQTLTKELLISKNVIEKELHTSTDYFAYPFGSLNQKAVDIVKKAGYKAAFTSSPGNNVYGKEDIFRIRRMPVKQSHSGFWGRIYLILELKFG